MLADTGTAEDATQETFIRVFRHIEKAPDEAEALGWIYRIATNYCLNEIRNRGKRPVPKEQLEEWAQSTAPELAGTMVDVDFARKLLAQVPSKLADVAWLHHVDGFRQGEVATILGISRRTVINRLQAFQKSANKILKGTNDV